MILKCSKCGADVERNKEMKNPVCAECRHAMNNERNRKKYRLEKMLQSDGKDFPEIPPILIVKKKYYTLGAVERIRELCTLVEWVRDEQRKSVKML